MAAFQPTDAPIPTSTNATTHNQQVETSNNISRPTTQTAMAREHPQTPPIRTTNQPTINRSQKLTSALASPNQASPTSEHAAADAEKAMRHTQEWKPVYNRRQSWSQEDQKREILMKGVAQDGDCARRFGFTEK